NLRFYAHQSGELFIHSAALKLNPDTTIDVGYHLDQTLRAFAQEARAAQLAFLDAVPGGMTAEQADAVALWRAHQGKPVTGVEPAELANDLIDIYTQPLRDALSMRQKLIDDYGVAPHRVRVAYGGLPETDTRYGESRWQRAHMLALARIRDNPVAAREVLVDTIRGTGEAAVTRDARAAAVAQRLFARHEEAAGAGTKYALLWVRDSRAAPAANRNGLDTQPSVLRQTIDAVRADHPDRRIVLVGDDLFARRPELRAAWDRDGVLDGVDTGTLVRFWRPELNGGQALSPAEQALFFHKLITERDMIQVGTESGALEIPFLLGAPTVYLENMVYHLNKGNRWAHIWQEWRYGEFETVLDEHGNVRFDPSAQPVRRFHGFGDPLPPPLPTVQRVQFGPDLANPKTRQGPIVMDFPPQLVALTADRIVRLVDGHGLDHWSARLGYSEPAGGGGWPAWDAQDWARSRYYADQLHRWLHTDASSPEAIGRKWDAIRLALKGVLDPGFTIDPEYAGLAIVHPYALLHSDHAVPADESARIARAYAADGTLRGPAVAGALGSLLGDPVLRQRAVDDLAVFRLEPAAVRDLRDAMGRVLAAKAGVEHVPGPPAERPPVSPQSQPRQPTPPAVVEAAARIDASTTRLVMAAIGLRVGTDLRNRVGDGDFYLALFDPADPSAGGRVLSARDFTADDVVAAADRLISMNDPAVDPILRQIAVRELARTWAAQPYDSVRAIAMQEVARDRFRPGNTADPAMDSALRKMVDNELEYNAYVMGEALHAQYDITQRELAAAAVPARTLYLPVRLTEPEHHALAGTAAGSAVRLAPGRPLEQWTSDRDAALRALAVLGERGAVFAAPVPVETILVAPETGLNGPRDGAHAVLGRPAQATLEALGQPGAAVHPHPAGPTVEVPPPGSSAAVPDPGPVPYDPRYQLARLPGWHEQVGELLRAGPDGSYPPWWPRDDSGYAPQARDLDYLRIDQQQFEWFLSRQSPLGMTPAQFHQLRLDLLEALWRDGIAPTEVDIRIKGSGARFFSGRHKEFPTEAQLAGNPAALAELRRWLGADTYRPRRTPFDALYRLGLDEPSDYDLDISSSKMIEYARRRLPELVHPDDFLMGHGYLDKLAVEASFPNLLVWRDRWQALLQGRTISLGVFESSGSFDRSEFFIVSEHFRVEDWKIHTPGGQ
ncbi:MAG TPA: hypothetical protein VFE14_19880, partial [Micromonosporaceae bacterium]|nr:hypothetical protein [Micromonosporaceae bacterium]